MNYQDFEGFETPGFAMNGHLPDTSETALSDEQPEEIRTETDYRTWNWLEAATEIGINESTLRKVWWEEDLEPVFRHCPTPLRVVARTVKKSGRQIEEFTPFGIEVLKAFKAAKEKGDRAVEVFLAEAKANYPAPEPAPASPPPHPRSTPTNVTVEVQTGNHNIVISPPELPQIYSLESLRNVESIEIEDPLALASQFLEAADQLQAAMERDIQQREQKLQQTRQAQKAVAVKAQELKLEQRLYRDRANQVSAAQTEETQALQEALTTLQSLGKSTPANAQAG